MGLRPLAGGMSEADRARLTSVETSHREGLLANRPAASTPGLETYFATNDNGGTLYVSDGTNWSIAGPRGIELGYAEITANATTISTTAADIAGLATTVTVRERPIKVIFDCRAVGNDTANGNVLVYIREGATTLALADLISAPAGLRVAMHREVRLAPTAGSHTYKISWLVSSGMATLYASTDHPAFIQVVEV